MDCPYCGTGMVQGEMRIYRPQWLTQVLWEATDPGWDGVLRVLQPGFIRRPRRPSYCCPNCEAYVIAPSGTTTGGGAPEPDEGRRLKEANGTHGVNGTGAPGRSDGGEGRGRAETD